MKVRLCVWMCQCGWVWRGEGGGGTVGVWECKCGWVWRGEGGGETVHVDVSVRVGVEG